MSTQLIDKYISELEAVKNYDAVKAQLGSERTRTQDLERKITEKDTRIQELESLASGLESVGSSNTTLGELQATFLASKEEEIENRAQDKFKAMKEDWEANKKLVEIREAAQNDLAAVLKSMSLPHPYFED